MKIKYIIASLFLVIQTSYGQNKHTEKADILFNSYQYVDAIDAYLKLLENHKGNDYVYKQLADSYYSVFNMDEASKWYAKAIESKQDAEVYYHYAQALKTQGKYEESNQQMNVFAKMLPNDQRSKDYLENPNYIPHLADKSKLFDVDELRINSNDQSDFGAVLSNDAILYFVSSRNTTKKNDQWSDMPYLDIYQAIRNSDGSFASPTAINELNTPYHDGPVTLSADGNTMFFARDGHSGGMYKRDKKNNVKLAQQVLYKATKSDGKWDQITALPINNKNYSLSHPSLSADGKTLYFASNMPGGLGDVDIWKVSIEETGYGKPQNLGPNVNSVGKEGFPFIDANKVLYFASNGKQGFGGFDVFKADLNTDDEAVNLGKPVNTEKDDFSFSFNTNKNIGYFSSNRLGVDNIYMAIPVCKFEAIALVKDFKTNATLSNAEVSILDSKSNVIATQQSNASGETSFDVECHIAYMFSVSKNGYESATFPIAASKGGTATIITALNPINEMITETEVKLKNIYFEFNKSNITQQGANELDKLVAIMKEHPEMNILVKSHTDTKGSMDYNLKLSDRRAQATVQYLISKGINKDRLSAKGIGSTEPKIDCKSHCTDEEDAQNRRSEFLIIK